MVDLPPSVFRGQQVRECRAGCAILNWGDRSWRNWWGAAAAGAVALHLGRGFSADAAAWDTSPRTLLKYTIPGYTTYDAATGFVKDNWSVRVLGSNIGNSDAVTNITSGQFIRAQISVRPRVVMFQLGYWF
jgi:hypothetical protein